MRRQLQGRSLKILGGVTLKKHKKAWQLGLPPRSRGPSSVYALLKEKLVFIIIIFVCAPRRRRARPKGVAAAADSPGGHLGRRIRVPPTAVCRGRRRPRPDPKPVAPRDPSGRACGDEGLRLREELGREVGARVQQREREDRQKDGRR